MNKILVTGGMGFIGSAFVRLAVKKGYKPVIVDKLTYAGDLSRIKEVAPRCKFYKVDICNERKIKEIFKKEKPQAVVHFAAETHVDRSIQQSKPFIQTNIIGTQNLLEASRSQGVKRFVHISTDEVYGEIERGKFKEDFSLKPNSPYSASKAAADLLIKSYVRTYGFPALIVRPSNNYGPWQYPEKLIPVIIYKALMNRKVPVYARGLNIREWLYVDDCARGILLVLKKGLTGEIYNLGSSCEERNINVVKKVLAILKRPYSLIEFVPDRPGHDFRYCLDLSKIKKLGFKPGVSFAEGIKKTVDWYIQNHIWLAKKAVELRRR